jgi:hypothetical protein
MGVVEDVRKVIQDLVAPELKSLAVEVRAGKDESKLRDEMTQLKLDALTAKLDARTDALNARLDAKFDSLNAKMDAQYLSIMNALDLNRRVESLERDKQAASA